MGYPKVFEAVVAPPPPVAYAVVRSWLVDQGARVKVDDPPRRLKAIHGQGFLSATSMAAKKILLIELTPAPQGTFIRITMPLSKWHFDDGRLLEAEVTATWRKLVDSLWVRFGYAPSGW